MGFSKFTRYAIFLIFLLAPLTVSGKTTAQTVGIAATKTPPTSLPPSPYEGMLSTNDDYRSYIVPLKAGQKLIVSVTYSKDEDFTLNFFPATDPSYDVCSLFHPTHDSTHQSEGVYYSVPKNKDGNYILEVITGYYDTGDFRWIPYHMEWKIVDAQPQETLPGIPAGPSPIIRSLDAVSSTPLARECFKFHVQEGQTLRFSITGPAGFQNYFGMYLSGPNLGSVDFYSAPFIMLGEGDYSSSYAVPCGKTGDYSITLNLDAGAGQCRLDYSIVSSLPEENYPGIPLPPSPVSGTLDSYTNPQDVYSIHLNAGQSLTVLPDNSEETIHFMIQPGVNNALERTSNTAYSSKNGLMGNKVFGFIAPQEDTYSWVILGAGQFSGNYRFQYKLLTISEVSRPEYQQCWIDATTWINATNYLYNDRNYTITEPYPSWMYCQTYIKTLNNDKDLTTSWSFRTDTPMSVVVVFNDFGRPAWLKNWKKLSDELTCSEPNSKRVLYARSFPAGKITLGGNRDPGMPTGRSMYSVILVPLGTIKGLNNEAQDWRGFQ